MSLGSVYLLNAWILKCVTSKAENIIVILVCFSFVHNSPKYPDFMTLSLCSGYLFTLMNQLHIGKILWKLTLFHGLLHEMLTHSLIIYTFALENFRKACDIQVNAFSLGVITFLNTWEFSLSLQAWRKA